MPSSWARSRRPYFSRGHPGRESNRDQIPFAANNIPPTFRQLYRDDVHISAIFYNVERLEVLKGPKAMLFAGRRRRNLNRVTSFASLN